MVISFTVRPSTSRFDVSSETTYIEQEHKERIFFTLLQNYFQGHVSLSITEETTVEDYLKEYYHKKMSQEESYEIFLRHFTEKAQVDLAFLQVRILPFFHYMVPPEVKHFYQQTVLFFVKHRIIFDMEFCKGYNLCFFLKFFLRTVVYSQIASKHLGTKIKKADEFDFGYAQEQTCPKIFSWEGMNRNIWLADGRLPITLSQEDKKIVEDLVKTFIETDDPSLKGEPFSRDIKKFLEGFKTTTDSCPGLLSLPLGFALKVLKTTIDMPEKTSLKLFQEVMTANQMRFLSCSFQESIDFIKQYFSETVSLTLKDINKQNLDPLLKQKLSQQLEEAAKLSKKLSWEEEFIQLIKSSEEISKFFVNYDSITKHILGNSLSIKKEYRAFEGVLAKYQGELRDKFTQYATLLVEIIKNFQSDSDYQGLFFSFLSRTLEIIEGFDALCLAYENRLKEDEALNEFIESLGAYHDLTLKEPVEDFSSEDIKEDLQRDDKRLDRLKSVGESFAKKLENFEDNAQEILSDIKNGVLSFEALKFSKRSLKKPVTPLFEFHYKQALFCFEQLIYLGFKGEKEGLFSFFQQMIISMATLLEVHADRLHQKDMPTVKTHDIRKHYPVFKEPSLNKFIDKFQVAILLARYPETIRQVQKYIERDPLTLLFERMERWDQLTTDEKLLCLKEIMNDFCCCLKVIHGQTEGVAFFEKIVFQIFGGGKEVLKSFSGETTSESKKRDLGGKYLQLQELKEKLEAFALKHHKRLLKEKPSPLSTIKNIGFQLSLIFDGLSAPKSSLLSEDFNRVRVIPHIDRAVELSLEFFSIFIKKERIISHHLEIYKDLKDHLSVESQQAYEVFRSINFGNKAHYCVLHKRQLPFHKALRQYQYILSQEPAIRDFFDSENEIPTRLASDLSEIKPLIENCLSNLPGFILDIFQQVDNELEQDLARQLSYLKV